MRLTELGREVGLVDDARWDAFNRKRDAVSRETQRLASVWITPTRLPAERATALVGKPLAHEQSLADFLRRPGVGFDLVSQIQAEAKPEDLVSRETLRSELGVDLADAVIEQLEISHKYAGYIQRQHDEVARAASYETMLIPPDMDYEQVSALSIEVRQRLSKHRPETLGQASRLSGVTPAAISLLLIHLKKFGKRAKAHGEAEA